MRKVDLIALARDNVKQLSPYSSARDDFQGTAGIYLDANENPFDTGFNRYPDPHQRALKQVLCDIKKTEPDQLFLGNGSDEAIDLLIRAFCRPGIDQVIIPQPTYGMYAVSAAIHDIAVTTVPLTPKFEIDSAAILAAVTRHTKFIFLCSPNNPTGNLLSRTEIENILKSFSGIVVLDEAYIDFASTPSWTQQLHAFNNLVVLQTLSKAWGLAGLRLGLCFADSMIIGLLNKIKPPYNISTFSQAEALRRITEFRDSTQERVQSIIQERKRLSKELKVISRVKHIHPSSANFLLVEIDKAKELYQELVSKGIIVRDRSNVMLCEGCLRITVGTPDENNQLIRIMQSL